MTDDAFARELVRWAFARAGVDAGRAPTEEEARAVGAAIMELVGVIERARGAVLGARKRPGRPPKPAPHRMGAATALLSGRSFMPSRSKGRARLRAGDKGGRPVLNDDDALSLAIAFRILNEGKTRQWAADRAAREICRSVEKTPGLQVHSEASLAYRLARKLKALEEAPAHSERAYGSEDLARQRALAVGVSTIATRAGVAKGADEDR